MQNAIATHNYQEQELRLDFPHWNKKCSWASDVNRLLLIYLEEIKMQLKLEGSKYGIKYKSIYFPNFILSCIV
jgi:hypothetical protein